MAWHSCCAGLGAASWRDPGCRGPIGQWQREYESLFVWEKVYGMVREYEMYEMYEETVRRCIEMFTHGTSMASHRIASLINLILIIDATAARIVLYTTN